MSGWHKALGIGAVVGTMLAGGCQETVTAPGTCLGACAAVQLGDTILTAAIASDTSYRGFFQVQDAPILAIANLPSYQALAVFRFSPRASSWINGTDTIKTFTIDSVRLTLQLTRRDTAAHHLWLMVYHVPVSAIDSNATYAGIAPLLTPSNLVDSIRIRDSVTDTSLTHVLPAGAFTPDTSAPDSGRVAAVVSLRADTATFATLAAVNLTGAPARLEWFARGTDTTKTQTLASTPQFDSFVQTPAPSDPTSTQLMAGGLPAARALIRFNIPRFFVDSTTIVKATLVFTPANPVRGFPRDSFGLEAHAIVRDYGPKSFFLTQGNFTGGVMVHAGDSTQIQMDITQIIRSWKGINPDSLPRSILLLSGVEGSSVGEVDMFSTAASSGAPTLRLTYVKPYTFGVP